MPAAPEPPAEPTRTTPEVSITPEVSVTPEIAHVSYTTTVQAAPPAPWWRRRPSPTVIALGAAASLALAILLGLLMSPPMRKAPAVADAPTPAAVTPATAVATFAFEKAREPYRPPSAAEVAKARADSDRAFRDGGVSELARAGLACFRTLEKQPSYGLMDYCLAYDLYGAAMNAQLAAGDSTSSSSWFGSLGARHLNVAQTLMGADGDADARLLDLRRMTGQTGVTAASTAPAPALPAPGALRVETVAPPVGALPVLPPPAAPPRAPAPRSAPPADTFVIPDPEPAVVPVAAPQRAEPPPPAPAPPAPTTPVVPEAEPVALPPGQ